MSTDYNRSFDCNIDLPDRYVDYTNYDELSNESDGDSTPGEYTKLPDPELEADIEIEMDDDDNGNGAQTRRPMRLYRIQQRIIHIAIYPFRWIALILVVLVPRSWVFSLRM